MGQTGFARGDDATIPPLAKPAHADITFDDSLRRSSAAAERSSCISVPGGETIDSLVVWLPDDRVALVGNMFSALFGHFPNLVTMRGDRMRNALAFVDSVQRVIDLEPEVLLLGHHGPVRGAATIRAECDADPRRGAVRARRDGRGDERRPSTCGPRCATIRLPDALSLGEAYGRVDWSVRAIWETLRGLVPPALDARALRRVARARRERDRRRSPAGPMRSRRRAVDRDRDGSAHRGAAVRARARGRPRPPRRAATPTARAHEQLARRARPRELLAHEAGSKARYAARRIASTPLDARMTGAIRIDDLRDPQLERRSAHGARLRGDARHPTRRATRCSAEARRRARCSTTSAPPDFRARLDATIAAVDADTGLGPLGRMIDPASGSCACSTARLLVEDLVRRQPEILAIELPAPIIVIGPAPLGHDASRQPHRGRHAPALAPLTGRASSRARCRATAPAATASTRASRAASTTTRRRCRWSRCSRRCTTSIPAAIEEEIELQDIDFSVVHARVATRVSRSGATSTSRSTSARTTRT